MRRPKKTTVAKSPEESGMPDYKFSLPVLLGLFLFFTIFGGGIAYLAFSSLAPTQEAQGESTVIFFTETIAPDTPAPTDTLVPTITTTPEPQPTLEPLSYVVQEGDSCSAIAGTFNISLTALITMNNLSASTCNIIPGQTLLVPQPTPIPTTEALATLAARQTEQACPIDYVTVQAGESIEEIAQFVRVPAQDILDFNGKPSPTLFEGELLAIPTCKITSDLTGATFTPSPAPTYQAPSLIQPAKGQVFGSNDEIVLQWMAPAELRNNEYFLLTIIDNTDGGNVVLEDIVKDTRYVMPETAQPTGNTMHIYAWKISVVAFIGQDDQSNPIYRDSSLESEMYYFAWGN
ncbi:LysM peptidoglycan-binding domain-containing protein [bacterium]|nr:LysM peptidoglycan-binding domain-containing protein [bacterium]MCB2179436.1 LysM peptidoglycan-binding domain-containing protein [bacterium]